MNMSNFDTILNQGKKKEEAAEVIKDEPEVEILDAEIVDGE